MLILVHCLVFGAMGGRFSIWLSSGAEVLNGGSHGTWFLTPLKRNVFSPPVLSYDLNGFSAFAKR